MSIATRRITAYPDLQLSDLIQYCSIVYLYSTVEPIYTFNPPR